MASTSVTSPQKKVPHRDRLLFPRFTPVVYNGGVLCYAATSVSDAGHGRDGQPSSGISQKLRSPRRRCHPRQWLLSALGIPLPYTDDGGNLTIEVTVGAENVRGVAQVFSSDLAFGTYPMQVIQ